MPRGSSLTLHLATTLLFCCVMIPSLVSLGNPTPFKVPPPGIHQTTLAEIRQRFAHTPHRANLFRGFCHAVSSLQAAGCRLVYLDGSFVTDKLHPNDFDACWDPANVDPALLDPTLLDFTNMRAAQKAQYRGELFIATTYAAPGTLFLDFFQTDRYSGRPKGLLSVTLPDSLLD